MADKTYYYKELKKTAQVDEDGKAVLDDAGKPVLKFNEGVKGNLREFYQKLGAFYPDEVTFTKKLLASKDLQEGFGLEVREATDAERLSYGGDVIDAVERFADADRVARETKHEAKLATVKHLSETAKTQDDVLKLISMSAILNTRVLQSWVVAVRADFKPKDAALIALWELETLGLDEDARLEGTTALAAAQDAYRKQDEKEAAAATKKKKKAKAA